VFYNGKKPLYKITTSSGRELKCTKEHKLYDGNSFVPLENIIDLKIDADNNVVDYRPSPIGVNGLPLHQSYEFLHNHKIESIKNGKGLQYIADKANVSYHTIRKWLKHYGLSYTKKEVAQYTEIWNKGKSEEYKLPRRTATQRQYMRDITPKGKNHHSYKGGGRCERLLIQSYINNRRKDIYDKCGEYCNDCKKTHISLELHHVEEVTRNPYKAYDLDNIVPLCKKCHQKRHRILRKVDYEVIYDLDNFDWVGIRPKDYKDHPYNGFRFKRKNSKDTAKKVIPKHTYNMDNIVSVEYIGLEDTYDLEIESTNHNYVANKIMVHNSQRYSEVVHFEKVELRKQAKSNRQSSADVIEDAAIIRESENFLADGQILYNDLLEHGVARETARMILPETAQSIVIFNGNIRSWISLLNQRLHHTAQKEARQVAESVKQIFLHHCPIISEMLFNFEHADKIHILDQVILEKYKLREQIL
jgi:thymidylate synthase (FAD)